MTAKGPEPLDDKRPDKPGYYWCKTVSYTWWNLIVEVYDEAPYLKTRIILARYGSNSGNPVHISDVGWGPRIEDPPKPKDYFDPATTGGKR